MGKIKTFKSTSLAIIIALGVEISMAQTARTVNPKSNLKTTLAGKTTMGQAQTFMVAVIGGEQALIVNGSQNTKCIINETLAKKNKLPFQFLVDMVSERRFDMECNYNDSKASDSAADSFYLRAYIE